MVWVRVCEACYCPPWMLVRSYTSREALLGHGAFGPVYAAEWPSGSPLAWALTKAKGRSVRTLLWKEAVTRFGLCAKGFHVAQKPVALTLRC